MRIQEIVNEGIDTYLGPFSAELWCTTGLSILVLTSLLALFRHTDVVLTQGAVRWPYMHRLPASFFQVFGIFCQQGGRRIITTYYYLHYTGLSKILSQLNVMFFCTFCSLGIDRKFQDKSKSRLSFRWDSFCSATLDQCVMCASSPSQHLCSHYQMIDLHKIIFYNIHWKNALRITDGNATIGFPTLSHLWKRKDRILHISCKMEMVVIGIGTVDTRTPYR